MKIRKSQLRRIIREEVSRLTEATRNQPWNARMGTGRRLPADWADSYEKLKDEFTQWFTDRDEASEFLSDVQFGGFEATASDWEPTMLLGRQGWEEIKQTLVDRGYMEPDGRFVIPDTGGPVDTAVSLEEDAPEGWEGTVKKMKKHKEIDNPYALSHWMKKRGAKSRYTKKGKRKKR